MPCIYTYTWVYIFERLRCKNLVNKNIYILIDRCHFEKIKIRL